MNDCSKNTILKLIKTMKFKYVFDTVVEIYFMSFLEKNDICLSSLPQFHILTIITFFLRIYFHSCMLSEPVQRMVVTLWCKSMYEGRKLKIPVTVVEDLVSWSCYSVVQLFPINWYSSPYAKDKKSG